MKRKRKKNNKKMILILIIVIILILSLVYILMPKNYGYNKKAIEVFKENDLYEQIKDKIDFSSVDVSFISLKHILPNLNTFLKDDGSAVCLIKPQFEAGKEKVGKKGVVSDPKTHLEVCEKVIGLAIENGFSVAGLDFSPIKGPEGNIEYLIYLLKSDKPYVYENVNAKDLVYKSHEEL